MVPVLRLKLIAQMYQKFQVQKVYVLLVTIMEQKLP
jgi:hypothetical protein